MIACGWNIAKDLSFFNLICSRVALNSLYWPVHGLTVNMNWLADCRFIKQTLCIVLYTASDLFLSPFPFFMQHRFLFSSCQHDSPTVWTSVICSVSEWARKQKIRPFVSLFLVEGDALKLLSLTCEHAKFQQFWQVQEVHHMTSDSTESYLEKKNHYALKVS